MNSQTKRISRGLAVLPTFVLILLTAMTVFAVSGDVDPTFSASAQYGINGSVQAFKTQTDGKIIVVGSFTAINGLARSGVARLNMDGSVDTAFNPPDFFSGFGLGRSMNAIGIQADGKVIIGGLIFGISNVVSNSVRRLNTDGSLDSSFNPPQLSVSSVVWDIEVLSDQKIIIGGDFTMNNPNFNRLARLNSNGTLDTSFAGNFNGLVKELKIQPDGKLLVGGSNFVVRLDANGGLDQSFSAGSFNGSVDSLELQNDGKMIISGSFSSVNGFTVGRIARLTSTGAFDGTFNQNLIGANGAVSRIFLGTNDKIAITGSFTTFNGAARNRIALLNSDGSLDTSFTPNLSVINSGNTVLILPTGKVLVGYSSIQNGALSLLNSDGSVDTSTPYWIGTDGLIRKIIQQPDGKIIVAGAFTRAGNGDRSSIARFNSDGTLDSTLTFTLAQANVSAMALQPDGKILFAASSISGNGQLFRINSDGTTDTSFASGVGQNITIYDIVVLPDGKILLGGDLSGKKISRLNSNGSNDATFNPTQPDGTVRKIYRRTDGKLWIAGDFTQISPFIRNRIALLEDTGALDSSFNPLGGSNNTIYDLDVQSDGKILICGAFTSLNGDNTKRSVGRFNPDGTLDVSFSAGNRDSLILAVKAQPSGKVLIGGNVLSISSQPRIGLERLNSNGSNDNSFNVGNGANDNVHTFALQSDGKILVGGRFTRIKGASTPAIARLLDNSPSTLRTQFDFDGDGKSDVSVFRPSTNRWYELLSSNSTVVEINFGISGDIVAPADFDGDGKTDVAIFRPSNGNWWYLSSINSAQVNVQFGANGDVPRPSDFDGDGKADFIVFRPSNSVWYRLGSGGTVSVVPFGSAGDKPLSGDFDGDGKSDVVIFRPSTGVWWYQSSINNAQIATNWGISTDIPVPADFDGDGKTDLAVYRPATGVWYIYNSSNGQATIVGFGISEDKPVAADYDGDGKADIAVFRPSSGIWYLLRSTAGFGAVNFGVSTDVPVQNAFIQ